MHGLLELAGDIRSRASATLLKESFGEVWCAVTTLDCGAISRFGECVPRLSSPSLRYLQLLSLAFQHMIELADFPNLPRPPRLSLLPLHVPLLRYPRLRLLPSVRPFLLRLYLQGPHAHPHQLVLASLRFFNGTDRKDHHTQDTLRHRRRPQPLRRPAIRPRHRPRPPTRLPPTLQRHRLQARLFRLHDARAYGKHGWVDEGRVHVVEPGR